MRRTRRKLYNPSDMKTQPNLDNIIVEKIIANQQYFNEFVYTPILKAKMEIQRRWDSKSLEKKLKSYFKNDIPKPMTDKFKAVIFRQLCTPNNELKYFMNIVDALKIDPLLFEHHSDKFASVNPVKHSLGKLRFIQSIREKNTKIGPKNIIEFNISDNKRLDQMKTTWNQQLIEFHHELLESVYPDSKKLLFNASEWFARIGGSARIYYEKYLSLFIRNGILFENFILNGEELSFVRDVFLPAFIKAWKVTGEKPIIVALLPIETQEDRFWLSQNPEAIRLIKNKNLLK